MMLVVCPLFAQEGSIIVRGTGTPALLSYMPDDNGDIQISDCNEILVDLEFQT